MYLSLKCFNFDSLIKNIYFVTKFIFVKTLLFKSLNTSLYLQLYIYMKNPVNLIWKLDFNFWSFLSTYDQSYKKSGLQLLQGFNKWTTTQGDFAEVWCFYKLTQWKFKSTDACTKKYLKLSSENAESNRLPVVNVIT